MHSHHYRAIPVTNEHSSAHTTSILVLSRRFNVAQAIVKVVDINLLMPLAYRNCIFALLALYSHLNQHQ